MKKRIKVNALIIFIATLLVILFPAIFCRVDIASPLNEATEMLGIMLILFGQVIRISARGHKSEHSKQGQVLIQDGPYALVRNPMYLGILLIGLGIVLIFFRWWVTAVFLLVFVIRYLLLIFKEEKKLLAVFSGEYEEYQQKVPRILPSLKALFYQDISEYLPLKWPWFKKEIGSALALLLVVLVAESWEDVRAEGIRVYLREMWFIAAIILLLIFLISYLNNRTVNANS
ncbi:MAG: isoprenylcysteine carboxylmethyltransferase family protein [Candidatus Omnitrophica bacterium]|nr:isoprenylcysteine carboxylmethyltransferase family protein [Candidatus Omnitrophota bacterium]